MNRTQHGFTLIEVLLALMIIAIGITALVKSTALNIQTSTRLKEKTIQHLIGMNTIGQIQQHMIDMPLNQNITQSTSELNQTWYWRAKLSETSIKSVQQITVSVSTKKSGPFTHQLIAYRYSP